MQQDTILSERVESALNLGFAIGTSFLVANKIFGKSAKAAGGRTAKVFVELQRKSFHMIGGCILGSTYHYGLKYGVLSSAYLGDVTEIGVGDQRPFDAGAAFMSLSFLVWMLEATRLQVPVVRKWYLNSFKGLVREKEFDKAAGIAFFIPGILAAMLAADSNTAIMGMLFLSIGDAAASIGTAGGFIPVGSSSRKVEGSIGCFSVCALIGMFLGLSTTHALITSSIVTIGELLAEVIGLDDNLIIPMLGVLGLRIAQAPQWEYMGGMGLIGLAIGVLLGNIVSLTTPPPVPPKDLPNEEGVATPIKEDAGSSRED